MNSATEEVRASFTFYASDTKALRRLTLALRDRGLDLQRTDVFRLLLEVTPEVEMMAHATLRLREEAKAPSSNETVDERFTVRLQRGWLKKLDRVVDDLARKDVDVERTFVARALVHAEHDVPQLARQAAKFIAVHPDRRFREKPAK
ncbi:MAG: hypothetical protein PSU94_06315 [Lacunisphaera sp.]|nr:hypothetical protein [Lacunisphaera sp.]